MSVVDTGVGVGNSVGTDIGGVGRTSSRSAPTRSYFYVGVLRATEMLRRLAFVDGDWWADHPRATLAVRAALYLAAAAVLLTLAAATVGFLGVLAAFAGVAALVDAGVPSVVPIGGLGVAFALTLAAVVVVGVRRLDARVAAAAERPDPVERLQHRYVNADIDEAEFERRLERLLGDAEAAETAEPSSRPAAEPSSRPAIEFESESPRPSAERRRESERA